MKEEKKECGKKEVTPLILPSSHAIPCEARQVTRGLYRMINGQDMPTNECILYTFTGEAIKR